MKDVALTGGHNLGHPCEATERRRVQDAIAIPLELLALVRLLLFAPPPLFATSGSRGFPHV